MYVLCVERLREQCGAQELREQCGAQDLHTCAYVCAHLCRLRLPQGAGIHREYVHNSCIRIRALTDACVRACVCVCARACVCTCELAGACIGRKFEHNSCIRLWALTDACVRACVCTCELAGACIYCSWDKCRSGLSNPNFLRRV